MTIILDTNVLRQSFSMKRSDLKTLLDAHQRAGHRLALPEVVLEELVNLYREEVEACGIDARKLQRRLKSLGLSEHLSIALDSSERHVRKYRDAVAMYFADAELLPLPEIEHTAILRRILQRKSPFRTSDAGYRDYLIWRSIVAEAADSRSIAFISNNTKDFCGDSAGELSNDLVEELPAGTTVSLYTGISAFNRDHILPVLSRLEAFRNDVNTGKPEALRKDQLAEQGLNWLMDYMDVFDQIRRFVPSIATEPFLDSIDHITDVVVNDVYYLTEGELLLALSSRVAVNIHAQVRNDELWSLHDAEVLEPADNEMSIVSFVSEFGVDFFLVLDSDNTVISGDVESVTP